MINGLTVAGMKKQFSDEHKIAQKTGFDPMPVVKFGDEKYVILRSDLVHPGHNTAEVINITAESTGGFEILVTPTDKKHSVGNAWISYGEEGGVFALAIFTEKNTVTDIRVRTAVLSYRLVPPTAEDGAAVRRMLDEEIEGAALMQQVEISMRLEQQILAVIPGRLRRLRQDSGWSQTELGKRLGISQQYVAQLEKGDRQPPAELLRKIAGMFNDPLPSTSNQFEATPYPQHPDPHYRQTHQKIIQITMFHGRPLFPQVQNRLDVKNHLIGILYKFVGYTLSQLCQF